MRGQVFFIKYSYNCILLLQFKLNLMLKLFTVLLIILFTLSASAQIKLSNEIIVEGGAKIKIKPDLGIFTLTVQKSDTIEKVALSDLNKTVDL